MKTCRRCGTVKPLSEFYASAKASDGHQWWCKSCQSRHASEWYRQNRKYRQDKHLRRTHGITRAEFDQMVASQNGLCAICVDRPAEVLDHHHESGRRRQALCHRCNLALGQLEEDMELMQRMIQYVGVWLKAGES